MKKIKVLVGGVSPVIGGRETYIMTQYRCMDDSVFHYDFIYCQANGCFPEAYKEEIECRGGRIFYVRNQKEFWLIFMMMKAG